MKNALVPFDNLIYPSIFCSSSLYTGNCLPNIWTAFRIMGSALKSFSLKVMNSSFGSFLINCTCCSPANSAKRNPFVSLAIGCFSATDFSSLNKSWKSTGKSSIGTPYPACEDLIFPSNITDTRTHSLWENNGSPVPVSFAFSTPLAFATFKIFSTNSWGALPTRISAISLPYFVPFFAIRLPLTSKSKYNSSDFWKKLVEIHNASGVFTLCLFATPEGGLILTAPLVPFVVVDSDLLAPGKLSTSLTVGLLRITTKTRPTKIITSDEIKKIFFSNLQFPMWCVLLKFARTYFSKTPTNAHAPRAS